MELRWRPSVSASCFHAVECLRRGEPMVDPALADALREPADFLFFDVEEAGAAPELLLSHLAPLSVQLDSNRELAAAALTKVFGAARGAPFREPLAGRISDLESVFTRVAPKSAEELPLRVEPLRMQWEARGPGLMAALARFTEPELLAEQADVALVQPICGGGGRAYRPYNTVLFEAVLTDAQPSLPETVRLAWLLSQLQLDLPRYSERLHRDELDRAAPSAMAVAALAAAEEVELARCDAATLGAALELWRIRPAVPPSELLAWWEECQASRPPWAIALEGLAHLRSG